MKQYTLIYNARLIDSNIDKKNSAVLICDDKIDGFPTAAAVKKMMADDSISRFDAKGCAVMPSFIDMHAHFRDPGLTYKEDIESGSMAAAAGGFGTVVAMPNTKPVISSLEDALKNNECARKHGYVELLQAVSITKDFDGKTTSHLKSLNAKKVPVISEDGKEVCDGSVMHEAMKIAAEKKLVVSCHCEDPFLAAEARTLRLEALKAYETVAQKRIIERKAEEANKLFRIAEDTMTARNISLARLSGAHLHLCHVSTEGSLDELRRARKEGADISAEITPHHIALTDEKLGTVINLVNPPLRSEKDRLACIQALKDGTADVIATDHAPHSARDKAEGCPGFSGLETAFAVCNTVLVKENGFTLRKLSQLMSGNPARLLGLSDRGLLEEGKRADLVVIDTEKKWTVHGEEFASRGKFTPFENKKLYGQIEATFLKGKIVFQN